MPTNNRRFRLTATVAVAALLAAQTLPRPVLAQGTPPPGMPPPPPQAATQDQQGGDPPARVGRLAQIGGTVSFHTQDATQWIPATLNYPVTEGDAFWTEPGGRAVIEISASRIAMAPGTELDVASLTESGFQAATPQGEIYLHVNASAPGESYAVQTPRGLVTFTAPGRYAVIAGDTQNPTVVTAVDGAAHVEGPGVSLDIGPNQAADITGSDTFQGQVGSAQRDAFLAAMVNSERPPQPRGVAPPPAVAAMPGGDDLAQYGAWSESQDYGQVWYPQVAPDWVPYREGSWAYVAPWGWTWVDSESWGFAPFHYGRWAEIGGRWGWIPGGAAGVSRPVYAPALVTFLGIGAVVGVGIGAALAAGRVGWCPLGPREAYHPWYRASDRYFNQVNVTHVTNFTNINRNVTINNFVNRGAATVVPTATMTGSRPVAASFQRVDPTQLAQARPVIGQQPLRPTTATVGITPAVARQFNLPPRTLGLQVAAPGPAIRGAPVVSTGIAAGAGAVIGHEAMPTLHNPAPTTLPAAAGAHPLIATPTLRPPPSPGAIGAPMIGHEATPALHNPAPTTLPAAAGAHPLIATPTLRTPPSPGAVGAPMIGHEPSTVAPGAAAPGTIPRGPQPEFNQRGGTPGTITHTAPVASTPPEVTHGSPPAFNQGGGTPAAITHTAPVTPMVNHTPPPLIEHGPNPGFNQGGGTPTVITHAAPALPPPVVNHPSLPVVHTPPAVNAPPPPPVIHTAPPPVHIAPPPAPQFHPPPAAPEHRPPPPPADPHKRPGEP